MTAPPSNPNQAKPGAVFLTNALALSGLIRVFRRGGARPGICFFILADSDYGWFSSRVTPGLRRPPIFLHATDWREILVVGLKTSYTAAQQFRFTAEFLKNGCSSPYSQVVETQKNSDLFAQMARVAHERNRDTV